MATQPEFTHTHRWRAGDLVMWDNRATMHRARRYNDTGEVRDMRRTTIEGEPTVLQQAA
jgi:alpha-ketoglutarate-dependent 2,4-dichlorophenoxyacetate dioxygenase